MLTQFVSKHHIFTTRYSELVSTAARTATLARYKDFRAKQFCYWTCLIIPGLSDERYQLLAANSFAERPLNSTSQ